MNLPWPSSLYGQHVMVVITRRKAKILHGGFLSSPDVAYSYYLERGGSKDGLAHC